MEKDSFFIKMEINAKRLKKNRDNSIYPLKYEKYADYIDKLTKEADEFKDLGKDTLNMEAVILSTEPSIPGDTTVIERNNKWRSQILTDNMLYEALKVCGEMEKLPCFKRREEKK
ncbi:hypothetical protein SDC9_181648 [bioreactor metagenome]|uniref:Uncharacterized protein n=1 Tax=bioreactor metagenome TaxID=1076179 RepID=A0A645H580_9ZZZZ